MYTFTKFDFKMMHLTLISCLNNSTVVTFTSILIQLKSRLCRKKYFSESLNIKKYIH